MDHIKNSPNPSNTGCEHPLQSAQAATLDLLHPNELAKLSPWQIDFRQLDAGRMKTLVSMRAGWSSSVLSISMNRQVHQRGTCPKGWTTFGISKRGTVPTWQGQSLDEDAFLTFGNNDGFDGVSTESFEGTVVSFDTSKLEAFSEACGFRQLGDGAATRLLPSAEAARRMARLKRRIQTTLRQPQAYYNSATEEALMIEVLSLLTDAEVYEDRSRSQVRSRAVMLAIDMMRANMDEPLSIEVVCRESGTSWRTMNRAFNERFGYGPKAYYNRLRLNDVRLELLEHATSDSIAEIANRYGFWHMGQFAKDYFRIFGELPSKTLQTSR